MEKNLTRGSIFKNIIVFSIPFFISFFLQTLYGLADLYFIGLYAGDSSTSAVSIGSQAMHMVTVMIVGLSMGSSVLIGKAVGNNDKISRNKVIGNTFTLFSFLSIILMAFLVLIANPFLHLLQTPKEAFNLAYKYILICFLGIPFIVLYNVIASIFRGMGDSKSPMYFILIACIINILLDYVFIGLLDLNTIGAALATVIAQLLSVLISIIFIKKKKMIDEIVKTDFKLSYTLFKEIFKIGGPVALQDGLIQVAFLLITVFANMRGLDDSAAVGIVEKIISILFLVPSTLLQSTSTLVSQNIGAKEHKRAEITLYYALAIALVYGLLIGVMCQFISYNLVSIFSKSENVRILGSGYLKSYSWDTAIAGIHFVFSGFFIAYKMSILSFVHNIISAVAFRIPLSYLFSVKFKTSLFPMGFAAPVGSFVSVLICIFFYYLFKKTRKKNINTPITINIEENS